MPLLATIATVVLPVVAVLGAAYIALKLVWGMLVELTT
jgi:hypothetical protein